MTTRTITDDGVGTVKSVIGAFLSRDLAALGALFHEDATWHHRNGDRLGGCHRGSDGIVAFLAETAHLTAGTLRPVPVSLMTDNAGRVCVLVQVSGTRPDGRALDDAQVVLFTVEDDRVRNVEQYVGDPAAVTEFWA